MKIIPFFLIFIAGCSMSIGSFERGLWYDSDERSYNPEGIGIKADIVCGRMVRPVSFDGDNPWEDPDFIIDCPMCGPFLSFAFGEFGIYVGTKTFKNYKDRYEWLPTEATREDPDILLTPSATIRRTRWK